MTIPTEHMFTSFAHHLSASGISFDGYLTHGTLFDVSIRIITNPRWLNFAADVRSGLDKARPVLLASEVWMPGGGTKAAKGLIAAWAFDRNRNGVIFGGGR